MERLKGDDNRAPPLAILDLLRWTSALAVVAGHVRNLLLADYSALGAEPGAATQLFYVATGFGHQAVVVFFVLSGYLVGGRLLISPLRERRGFTRYLIDRAARIYLVLIPALVVTFAAALIVQHRHDAAGVFGAVHWSAALNYDFRERLGLGTLACNLANLQSAFCEPYGHNGPLWSLSYEWFYYVSFPLALAVASRCGMSRCLPQCAILAALTIAALLIFPAAVAYYPIWLTGAASRAIGCRRAIRGPWAAACTVALVAVLTLSRREIITGLGADYVIAAALGVCLISPSFLYGGRWRGNAWLAGFSYSLYATHFPIVVLLVGAFQVGTRTAGRVIPTPGTMLAFGLILVGSYCFAYFFSLASERHTQRVRRWLTGLLMSCETDGQGADPGVSGKRMGAQR